MNAGLAQKAPPSRGDGAPLAVTLAAFAAGFVVAGAFLAGVEGAPEISLVALAIPAAIGLTLLALRRPVVAVTTVFVLMAFSGFIEVNMGIPARPPIYVLLSAIAAATLISYAVTVRTKRATIWPGVIVLFVFVLYAAVHIPFAETLEVGGRGFLLGPSFILVFFAIAYARWTDQTRWRIFQALIVVALITGAYALFRLIVGPTAAEQNIARLSAGIQGDLALFGSLPNRVQLGGFSAILTPAMLAAALTTTGRWRLASIAAFGLIVVALFGSQVRIALVAAVIGIAVVIVLFQASRAFSTGKYALTSLAVAGLLVTGALGYALTISDSPAKEERFSRILNPGADYSFQQRLKKWEEAVDQINREPLGQGLGTAGTAQRRFSRLVRLDNFYVDNSYLQLGIQLGYPGVLLLVTGCVLILWLLAKSAILTTDKRRATLGIAGSAALVTWLADLVGGNNLELWGAVLLWILLGVTAGAFVSGSSSPRRGVRSIRGAPAEGNGRPADSAGRAAPDIVGERRARSPVTAR